MRPASERKGPHALLSGSPGSVGGPFRPPSAHGFISACGLIPLGRDAVGAFKPGRNVLAVHCHQTRGGQYIDAGLIDFVEKAE